MADTVSDAVVPIAVTCDPGLATVTGVAVLQLTAMLPARPAVSAALTMLLVVPAADGVPMTEPVDVLMESPTGNPVAVHVYGAAPPAAIRVIENATPTVVSCDPGLDTVTGMVTAQVNEMLPMTFLESLAVTVGVYAPATVGVPETTPVEFIDNPLGKPLADQVYGVLPPEAVIANDAATPVVAARAPGFPTTTPVVQVKDALFDSKAASLTVTFVE